MGTKNINRVIIDTAKKNQEEFNIGLTIMKELVEAFRNCDSNMAPSQRSAMNDAREFVKRNSK